MFSSPLLCTSPLLTGSAAAQVRSNYYGLLGCMECIDEANAAAALEAACSAATSEDECSTASAAAHGPDEPVPIAVVEPELIPEVEAPAPAPEPVSDMVVDVDIDIDVTGDEDVDVDVDVDADEPAEYYATFDTPFLDEVYGPVGAYAYDEYERGFAEYVPGYGDGVASPLSVYEPYAFPPESVEEYFGAYAPGSFSFEPYYGAYAPEPLGGYYDYSFGAYSPAPAVYDFGTTYDYSAYATAPYDDYFSYGDYPAPAGALDPAVAPESVPLDFTPLDLEGIDVGGALGLAPSGAEGSDEDGDEEGISTEEVRDLLDPVLADAGARLASRSYMHPVATGEPVQGSLVTVASIFAQGMMCAIAVVWRHAGAACMQSPCGVPRLWVIPWAAGSHTHRQCDNAAFKCMHGILGGRGCSCASDVDTGTSRSERLHSASSGSGCSHACRALVWLSAVYGVS